MSSFIANFLQKGKDAIGQVSKGAMRKVERQISGLQDNMDSARGRDHKSSSRSASLQEFQSAWENFKTCMVEYSEEQAAQRFDTLDDEFEAYVPDEEADEEPRAFQKAEEANRPVPQSIDFYNREGTDATGAPAKGDQRRQSLTDVERERAYLEKKIKPCLQGLINNLLLEEKRKTNESEIGFCVDLFLEEKMLSEILGWAVANRPRGILFVALRFSHLVLDIVKSADVFDFADAHHALFQLLQFIHKSLENDMLHMNANERKILIEFLLSLTKKITYHSPKIAEVLLADQTSRSRKEKRYDYLPLQILLHLFILEDMKETEQNQQNLRKCLLLMIKQSTMNPKIKDYVLTESELSIILIGKLAHYYSYLPSELQLIKDPNVSEYAAHPNEDQEYHTLNLAQQITQSFPKETIKAHTEFVKYCVFLNLVAETVQIEPKLANQLQVCLFNYFCIDSMQARLITDKLVVRRTALQYLEQMLDLFTCSDLVLCLFHFLTGLPTKTREEELQESDDMDSSNYNTSSSRLSLTMTDSRVSFGRKRLQQTGDGQSTNVSDRSLREPGGMLSHFNLRMKQINLETKNREAHLAIRGPNRDSLPDSVSSSVVLAHAQDRIIDEKAGNILNLIDSVLRRNKEGREDDDDVLFEEADDVEDIKTQDIFDYDASGLQRTKIDFYYNREEHQLQKLFYNLAKPESEEKLCLVALKVIDGLLRTQLPKILDFFIFGNLRKVLQRTDWLRPATEQIKMTEISELRRKFILKFPAAGASDRANLAIALGKVDMNYFTNNENFITGDPKENFDSRKTKIKDEHYSTLLDQLVQEWYESEELEEFDGVIIESPKNCRSKQRRLRLFYLQEPENLMDEEAEELHSRLSNLSAMRDSSQAVKPTTYRFADLAELIVDKEKELEFSDLNESEEMDDDSGMGLSVGGLRVRPQASDRREELEKRMSVGDLAPGIKVRTKEEILNQYNTQPQEFVGNNVADPVIYSTQGGFFKFLKDLLNQYMSNEPEVNLLLAGLLVRLCSYPVKLDIVDGQFNSTTSPFDKTHGNLTMLHMLLFDQPLQIQKVDVFSVMSSLAMANDSVTHFLSGQHDMNKLIAIAKRDGQFRDLSVTHEMNPWQKTTFTLNRKQIFNTLIFKELLNSMAACLSAKELVGDMVDAYENACAEDTALEASFAVFARKKQLQAKPLQQLQQSAPAASQPHESPSPPKIDLFGLSSYDSSKLNARKSGRRYD